MQASEEMIHVACDMDQVKVEQRDGRDCDVSDLSFCQHASTLMSHLLVLSESSDFKSAGSK